MLVRYDLCFRAVCALRAAMKMANGWSREAFVDSVMATRSGLDRAKVAKLVDEIFEAEN